jgi:hypothetical protein
MGPEESGSRFGKLLSTPQFQDAPEASRVKASDETLKEIDELFQQYSDEIWHSDDLATYSKAIYIDNANSFIRWMRGDFKPGAAGLKPRRRIAR